MTAKSYSLTYDGYWREVNARGIPAQSGIYSVYACRHNPSAKTVTVRKLVYIGEAQNVRDRISRHEKWPLWRRHLSAGEVLCFNFAPIIGGRARVEAALIHHHKPPENTEYVDTFPYEETRVSTSGKNKLLASHFTVHRTRRNVSSASPAHWS